MKLDFKKIWPHFIAIAIFLIAALAYFSPVLSGKKLYQNDIVQYKGNASQLLDYRAQGEDIYWTDSAFGGMPTYQLGARYDYDFFDSIDRAIRFLPRPADYLFLYLISFYILMLVMRIPWKIGIIGALAFGFSTYLIIILGVGHNAKAHAIGYFPLVLSGILLVFQKRYLWGFLLTALAMGLELQANHPQMTYYLGLSMVILGIAYFIDAIRKGLLLHFFKSTGILVVAVLLAFGTNSANLMATSEYSKESTRGPSSISINAQGESVEPQQALPYDYITEYSYGLSESLNLIIPSFAGGGSGTTPDADSRSMNYLLGQGIPANYAQEFLNTNVSTYWGAQPIVEAPAYLGVSVVFLAVIALFLIKGRLKWWTLGSILLALLLSYGDNFSFLTKFFIQYVPFYDKFRAVTSIQVIIEFLVPVLAAVGLYHIFNDKTLAVKRKKALLFATAGFGGFLLMLILLGGKLFDFAGPSDGYFAQNEQLGTLFVEALRKDRLNMMRADAIKALVSILIIAAIIYTALEKKVTEKVALIVCALVILIDLVSFDLQYVNEEDYVSAREYDNALPYTQADAQIQQDQGHFKVYDLLMSPLTSARASKFHKALGGYHGAKPRRFYDLHRFYFEDENTRPIGVTAQNIQLLSMLNARYVIDQDSTGVLAQRNPLNLGPAWFVKDLKVVENQNEEILQLKNLDGDNHAYITKDQYEKLGSPIIKLDSAATVKLTSYHPEKLTYTTQSNEDGVVLFSEMYYPHGWQATVDGKTVPIVRANYALRAIAVPAGKHEVTMKFEPEVVATGTKIMLASNALLLLLFIGGLFYEFRKSK